jgi:hypothetical protein
VLVVVGFRVGVAVDNLYRPLGILELHLFLVIALIGNLLLAFPLAGRRAIVAKLLLVLLTELLCELLDLSALLGTMAPGIVHWAPRPTLVAPGGLASLVTAWAATPTSRCSNSGCSGSTCQQLVVAAVGLLLLILVLATALSSGIYFRLASLPYLRSRLGVPCMPFCGPGTLVWPTSRASSHLSHPIKKQQQ